MYRTLAGAFINLVAGTNNNYKLYITYLAIWYSGSIFSTDISAPPLPLHLASSSIHAGARLRERPSLYSSFVRSVIFLWSAVDSGLTRRALNPGHEIYNNMVIFCSLSTVVVDWRAQESMGVEEMVSSITTLCNLIAGNTQFGDLKF